MGNVSPSRLYKYHDIIGVQGRPLRDSQAARAEGSPFSSSSSSSIASTLSSILIMASKAQGSSSMKVLIVEDDAVQRMVLSNMLRKFQCEITMAMNGKEAVDLFLEGNKFDIIFCDKDMPIMTGPEAVVKIRAMGETGVKIVGMSADDHAMEVFISAGANVYVPKPMKVEALKCIIQEVISKNMNTMV
ncbi:Peroxide stress-activated histidine kinase mak2 [Hordeum vulgare]|nr:two-component response regulator ORR42-like [Hordeum vulgare subsp. vulgare]KAE8808657.1 Peroxide stress-activated histidine kinase mak2 [Hordeum vulgare]KAI4966042.1 hypothetical protein ZWY2020_046764 [Hordeum vulgare]